MTRLRALDEDRPPKGTGRVSLGRSVSTTARSIAQEDRIAASAGGRRQKGSGNRAGNRGDVRRDELLMECKTTATGTMSIERAWLEKISGEAAAVNKDPAFVFSFEGQMPEGVDRDWIAVPARLFPDEFRRGRRGGG